jgi:hypothetical protein
MGLGELWAQTEKARPCREEKNMNVAKNRGDWLQPLKEAKVIEYCRVSGDDDDEWFSGVYRVTSLGSLHDTAVPRQHSVQCAATDKIEWIRKKMVAAS